MHHRLLRTCVALAFGLSMAGNVHAADANTSTSPDRYAPPGAALEDYKLGVGDKLKVTVFNEPTLSGDFTVGASGVLSLPLIGDVPAVGKGASDLAAIIQSKLADGYLKAPQVAAEVSTYRPFFILGEVKAPGQYPYANGLTVYNAIATAQGFTPRAARKTVYIRRAGSDKEEAFQLSPDLKVLPGDTIRLGERYF